MSGTVGYFGISMTICLTYCLCIDLILMLRWPLKQKGARTTLYHIWSGAISTSVCFFYWLQLDNLSIQVLRVLVWGVLDSIIIIAPISICYAWVKLSKPGLSSEVRSLILSRHLYTMLFFLVANSYILLSWTVALLPSVFEQHMDPIIGIHE